MPLDPFRLQDTRSWFEKARKDLYSAKIDYAWQFRYPGPPRETTLREAQDSFALAREAVDAILDWLPEEARLFGTEV